MTETATNALASRLERLARDLPGVETGTSYGAMALKVAGKLIACAKTNDVIVLSMPLDEKEHFIEMAPDVYFETPHYHGWPAVLVHADAISDAELRQRIAEAWLRRAPAKLRRAHRPEATDVSGK
ncbi:MmcQ/YjbR family DNA-binding protein [Rhizobium sp. ARZ01]|uniref:MmcQ/YjbR family DNA-binding protein n=1 Tax=Rhizobium sp. ARZ01 TaxID=2769313 RepID=UPI00178346CD|nr:MmcQ/YjbR family DNA-binding protein [Rhizobium sp. ARZ01]MBD9371411.1 MmcQ/YjbR family DNA-binding protein [Rhizobium sp. ARZ01]